MLKNWLVCWGGGLFAQDTIFPKASPVFSLQCSTPCLLKYSPPANTHFCYQTRYYWKQFCRPLFTQRSHCNMLQSLCCQTTVTSRLISSLKRKRHWQVQGLRKEDMKEELQLCFRINSNKWPLQPIQIHFNVILPPKWSLLKRSPYQFHINLISSIRKITNNILKRHSLHNKRQNVKKCTSFGSANYKINYGGILVYLWFN
jgi:hypothetical protein